MESFCQYFDKLPEIHAFVGDIVEDGLVTVALVFHVTDLHLQSQVLCYLPALNHCAVFSAFGLSELVHIGLLCDSVDTANLIGRFQVCFFDLQFHQPPSERHHTDVVAWISFNGYDIAFLQVEAVHIVIISLACVLELHFHKVGGFRVAGNV